MALYVVESVNIMGKKNDFGLCINPKCDEKVYLCGKCRRVYPLLAQSLDQARLERKNRGGTYNSTAFRSVPQRNDPSITNHYFNGPGDGEKHGHVKERINPDGSKDYPYARDVEGRETNRD